MPGALLNKHSWEIIWLDSYIQSGYIKQKIYFYTDTPLNKGVFTAERRENNNRAHQYGS